jgi:hypothetical protein
MNMTLQELQKQALQMPISDRWHLVQTLLESLKQEMYPSLQRVNLSQLREVVTNSAVAVKLGIKHGQLPNE